LEADDIVVDQSVDPNIITLTFSESLATLPDDPEDHFVVKNSIPSITYDIATAVLNDAVVTLTLAGVDVDPIDSTTFITTDYIGYGIKVTPSTDITDIASNAYSGDEITESSDPSPHTLADNAVVTTVSSSETDDTYNTGKQVAINVTFDKLVIVTNTPVLNLDTGTDSNSGGIPQDAVVNYASGSVSTILTFNYTVESGHYSVDLDYTSTSALDLDSSCNENIASHTTEDLCDAGAADHTDGSTNGTGHWADGVSCDEAVFSHITQQLCNAGAADHSDYVTHWIPSSIKDLYGNSATLTLPEPGASGSLGNSKNIVINTIYTIIKMANNPVIDGYMNKDNRIDFITRLYGDDTKPDSDFEDYSLTSYAKVQVHNSEGTPNVVSGLVMKDEDDLNLLDNTPFELVVYFCDDNIPGHISEIICNAGAADHDDYTTHWVGNVCDETVTGHNTEPLCDEGSADHSDGATNGAGHFINDNDGIRVVEWSTGAPDVSGNPQLLNRNNGLTGQELAIGIGQTNINFDIGVKVGDVLLNIDDWGDAGTHPFLI
ncbi:uncharacterized protein METZ01_LOCUS206781, partial [marine metagenome]